MFVREEKEIQVYVSDSGLYATIHLSNLAVPETVSVTYRGKKMLPMSFGIYGEPVFSDKQALIYRMSEEELQRNKGSAYRKALATVEYEVAPCVEANNLKEFDTVAGISRNLSSLKRINDVINSRKRFVFNNKKHELNEFMILGCFRLNKDGTVDSLVMEQVGKVTARKCEKFDTFLKNNTQGDKFVSFTYTRSGGFTIPEAGQRCPCCGKAFTIVDLTKNPCIMDDGEPVHYSCYKDFNRSRVIDKFARIIMGNVYYKEDNSYTYELLPNGYCSKECCEHIPWFKFHTIHGDIIIGERKRVISIEWQENYKEFDFAEVFAGEQVTKWKGGGKRGIHAWGQEKAIEYLKKALKAVEPDYEETN